MWFQHLREIKYIQGLRCEFPRNLQSAFLTIINRQMNEKATSLLKKNVRQINENKINIKINVR